LRNAMTITDYERVPTVAGEGPQSALAEKLKAI
jgi:hypothetical protein